MAGTSDLDLLEKVFFSLGSADTDEQLETRLAKFLPPVLLKLCSPEEVVRKKVMELLIHVNKRLKSRPKVMLPVDALLQQYQEPSSSPFVTNFSILYIKMGFPRLSMEEQANKVTTLIRCLENKPASQQDSLLQLLTPVLGHVKFPDNPEVRNSMYSFSDKPQVKKLFLDYLLDVMIFPYSTTSGQAAPIEAPAADQEEEPSNQPVPVQTTPGNTGATASTVPPGLCETSYKRVIGDRRMTPDELEKAKMGILRFLAGDTFPEQEVICILVLGASDTRHSVATYADMEVKRIAGSADWNDPAIVNKLFNLFLGTIILKGQDSNTKKSNMRSAVSTRVKLKIFPQILKSREAANTFPQALQAVFECMYGANTNKKLKKMSVQFVHHLCLYCKDEKLSAIGQVLINGMVNLIQESKDDAKLRNITYLAVGKLGNRLPHLVCNDISLAQNFFDAISKEDSETRLAVQEALSMLASTYRNMEDHNKALMEALIIQNFEKDEPQARIMAVKYSQTVFPPDHVSSRYLLLLACGDAKEDIYSEAVKALRSLPTDEPELDSKMDVATGNLPKFENMVNYMVGKARERLSTHQTYAIGTHVLPFNPVTYGETLMYLRMCLANDAGIKPNLESLKTMQEDSPVLSKHIQSLLNHPGQTGPIQKYIQLIIQLVRAIGGPPAMFCLLEVVAIAGSTLASQFVEHLEWIKAFIFNSKEDMRNFAAQLYAIIITRCQTQHQVQDIIEKFINNLTSKTFEVQHGSMLAVGYLIAEQRRRVKEGLAIDDMETESSRNSYNETVVNALTKIVSFLKDRDEQLLFGACTTLSEIGRSGPLPLPPGGENESEGQITKMSIVKDLLNVKNKERSALCLGHLCVGEPDFCHHRYIINQLTESVQSKQVELHFGIGEALVYCAEGSSSPAARNMWLQTELEYQNSVKEQGDLEWYLNLVLGKYVNNKNPFLRQASCIWLLLLVKKCGSQPVLQSAVGNIQAAFMRLLSESDDLTQDVASKGLGLVYENCTEEQKKSLVQELVDTLTTGKRQSHKIEGDSQVFDQGALGKSPDGGGLSTYRELCSIANDLNQPDLIYKFMHLANHNAMWNSRKGAAFGFSTIAAQAGEQLEPYLPEIVPKLYRYQFDPNPKIQGAMSSIWSALVKDNKKTVDKFMKEILNDLIKNLTSNQWRVRESSCSAVNDLLRGRSLDDVVDQLPDLWESCLRVRDDIKESVRVSAEAACKTLSRASVRICDITNGKIGEKAISVVLPCLLSNSLKSPVEEVRAIGLSTILKISKNAGVLLKPHIPVLVVAFLEAVSGLEPQMMNYLSLHANSSQDTQDKIDSVRIAASKMSPMMETVNLCVQYVDDSVLKELMPRLTDLIRGGIGVGTKAGCSSFITSLVHHCPQDLAPYSGKIMGALLNGLHDKNSAIRKCNASALGHVAKIAKDSSVEKLIERLKSWYMEKDDETAHQASGLTLQAISHHSPDVLKKHGALTMPFVFFAMHQKLPSKEEIRIRGDEEEISVWQEVWLDTTPGTEAGLKLYLEEIVQILMTALDSSSWHTKAQAARAMSTVASKLRMSLIPPHLGNILNALLGALSGRTWTGKESLLQSLSTVCTSCSLSGDSRPEGQPSTDEIIEVILKECKREKLSYKRESVDCLGAILDTYRIDRFKDTWEILNPYLDKKSDEDKDKEEEEETHSLEDLLKFEEVGYKVLGQAWPSEKETQDEYQEEVVTLISTKLPKSMWKVQLVMLKTIRTFLKRLILLEDNKRLSQDPDLSGRIVNMLLSQAIRCLGNIKYSSIRQEALAVIEILVQKLSVAGKLDLLGISLKDLLNSLLVISRNSRSELQDRAKAVEKLLSECDMDWS